MLVLCLLNVEGSLALDLSSAAFVVFVFGFAVSKVESILQVCQGVFRALADYMVVAVS